MAHDAPQATGPSKLVIRTQPLPTVTAGRPFASQPIIVVEDGFGNIDTSDETTVITASLAGGGGPLQGTTTAPIYGGVATFSDLADDMAGTITVQFTGGGLHLVLTPRLLALGLALSLVTGALGGLYPAWRASRLVPMDAIRRGTR